MSHIHMADAVSARSQGLARLAAASATSFHQPFRSTTMPTPKQRRVTIRSPYGDPKTWELYRKILREVIAEEGAASQLVINGVEEVMKDAFERSFPQGTDANISGRTEIEMLTALNAQQQAVINKLFERAAWLAFVHLRHLESEASSAGSAEPASGLSRLWRRASKPFKNHRAAGL